MLKALFHSKDADVRGGAAAKGLPGRADSLALAKKRLAKRKQAEEQQLRGLVEVGAPEDFHTSAHSKHSRSSEPTHTAHRLSGDGKDRETSDVPPLPMATSLPEPSSAATAIAARTEAAVAVPTAAPAPLQRVVHGQQRQSQQDSAAQGSPSIQGGSCPAVTCQATGDRSKEGLQSKGLTASHDSSDHSDASLDDANQVAACLRTDSLVLAKQRGCREKPTRHNRPRPRPHSLELTLARLSHHPSAAGPRATSQGRASQGTRARRLSLSDVPGPSRHPQHVLQGQGSSSTSSFLRPGMALLHHIKSLPRAVHQTLEGWIESAEGEGTGSGHSKAQGHTLHMNTAAHRASAPTIPSLHQDKQQHHHFQQQQQQVPAGEMDPQEADSSSLPQLNKVGVSESDEGAGSGYAGSPLFCAGAAGTHKAFESRTPASASTQCLGQQQQQQQMEQRLQQKWVHTESGAGERSHHKLTPRSPAQKSGPSVADLSMVHYEWRDIHQGVPAATKPTAETIPAGYVWQEGQHARKSSEYARKSNISEHTDRCHMSSGSCSSRRKELDELLGDDSAYVGRGEDLEQQVGLQEASMPGLVG